MPASPGRLNPSLPSLTPIPTLTSVTRANGTLVERCGGGDCTFSGEATTLQASVVTTTILSTTSVPCYITTYVTDSTTTTATVYSTETITSTVTSEGTVYVIQYSPTPVLLSTLVQSIIEITESWYSYWTTESGSAYAITSSGDGGYVSASSADGSNNGWSAVSSSSGSGSGSGSQSAWTHVDNAIAATGTSSTASAAAVAGGVTVATNNHNGWSAGTATSSAGVEIQGTSNSVKWSAACPSVGMAWHWGTRLYVCLAVSAFTLWEVDKFLA